MAIAQKDVQLIRRCDQIKVAVSVEIAHDDVEWPDVLEMPKLQTLTKGAVAIAQVQLKPRRGAVRIRSKNRSSFPSLLKSPLAMAAGPVPK
jgi:hypothetical protein